MSSTTPSNRSSRRLGRAGSAAAAAMVLSVAVGVGIVSASASATAASAPVSVSAMGHNPHQPAEGYGASPSAPGSSHIGRHRG
ncbi:hypothetical protein [Clavibacter michiganensis]|uniref:hypothetical protein n=1 Tax=Clavibacter michiganensis TaxID=28447 RepID=UPI0005BC050C|nr:hypothetical protein [Clavibacter michiganensis]